MNETIEQRIVRLIDANQEKLIEVGKALYHTAEPGFREYETAKKMANFLKELGLEVEEGLCVTGLRAVIKGEATHDKETTNAKSHMTVGIIGELDGIPCSQHPQANPSNGVSHACGHNLQMMGVMGAAIALNDPTVKAHLDGVVHLLGIPAEEYINEAEREALVKEGKVKYGVCGKNEWILEGHLDDVDLVLTHHVHMVGREDEMAADVLMGNNSCNGFIAKVVTITGKAAHAACNPQDGINALNAATLGLSAVGYLRETFRDEDHVRVHGIITEGGTVTNVVPDCVKVNMQVRAKTLAALEKVSRDVDRAFEGASYALGAQCQIESTRGYLPIIERGADEVMVGIKPYLREGITCENVDLKAHNSASTDVGDLTHLMPVLNFTTGGTRGALHSKDFEVTDDYKAYILPAKIMALTTYRLLCKGAQEAEKIVSAFEPELTKEDYLAYTKR